MERLHYWLEIAYEYTKDYLLENTGLKILALLITAVLWLSVASRPVSDISLHNIPIELVNLPKDTLPTKIDTMTATVTLRGPRDLLDSLQTGELTLLADMSGFEPGVRVIPLKLDASRLPSNIESVGIGPRSIRVTLEREVTRQVPVKPRFDGDPSPGFEMIKWQVQPDHVVIVGAASQVKDINEVSTETVSLDGKSKDFSGPVAIDIGSPNVNIQNDTGGKVNLSVTIGEALKERLITGVPITIQGDPGAIVGTRSVSVKVKGPGSKVDGLGIADLAAVVDFHRGAEREQTLKIIVTAPGSDAVQVLSVSPEAARVRGR